jgi:hypothetical protein
MTEMELVDRETADGSESSEDVTARIGISVGHHTAIGETAAVDAFAVDGIF